MAKTFNEICKAASYKLTGNGDRCIGMLSQAFQDMDSSMEADIYGAGRIINDFEREIAELLGKESAVFFPSGTMAQQIAMRIWCEEKRLMKVAYHPLCHMEIHEKDGLKILHHIDSILLGDSSRLFTLEDVKAAAEPHACLLIELPQREIGGQLPAWEELVEISEYCRANGVKLHLDGARLFESLPFYGRPAKEVCSLFDSVYVSFYKGLGGIAGAALCGSIDFTEQSKVWKRRHGGDLISLFPYIVNAGYCMKKRMGKMEEYWKHALKAAHRLNQIKGVKTVPEVPVCNMFHAYFDAPKEKLEGLMTNIIDKYGVALVTNLKELNPSLCKSELSFGDSFGLIPPELLDKALTEFESEYPKLQA